MHQAIQFVLSLSLREPAALGQRAGQILSLYVYWFHAGFFPKPTLVPGIPQREAPSR
jgi:hypothetical protein